MLLEAIYELNKQNPEKSEILIQGYGRMTLDRTKANVITKLEETIAELREEDSTRTWNNAHYRLYKNGVVEAMMEAITEANKELDDIEAAKS